MKIGMDLKNRRIFDVLFNLPPMNEQRHINKRAFMVEPSGSGLIVGAFFID